jgi:hypothetical protein
LDSELNNEFYSKKLRLSPSDETPPSWFKHFLEKWIQSGSVEDVAAKSILLDNHYKYDIVDNMLGLSDVIDKKSSASFL